MATIDEIYSWLLASKQGDEVPNALTISDTDKILFWNITDDKLNQIDKSLLAGNIATTPEFLGSVSTSGATTTETEIKDFINATGFTIGINELKILKLNVYINNVIYIKQYLFKANLADTYGTGNTVIVFSDLWEIEEKILSPNNETTTTITVGDISPETAIEDFINLNNDVSWDLQANIIYVFTATIDSIDRSYLYVGVQPQLIGQGNNAVSANDFVELAGVNSVFNNIHEFTIDTISTSIANGVGKGLIDIQYEATFDKVVKILFDEDYTDYLEEFAAQIGNFNFVLNIYNKTQKKSLMGVMSTFTYTTGANKYYEVDIDDTMDRNSLAVDDIIEFQISVQPKGERLIDGYWVDTTGNTDVNTIEVGNQIRGNFSASRYIIADVTALPHTNEANLEIYLDAEK